MMFTEGNFDIPMFVHDQVPPGVPEMQKLKSAISYKYEETQRGGRVLISSDDPQAVLAVQSFLRFQITEHKTGDSLEVHKSL
jgi:TusA-related sulfurtransferase